MKKTRFKERELDLADLFCKLLEQWRGLILAGLVLSLMLSAVMVIKNRRSDSNTEIDPDVLNVLSIYADFMDKREHYKADFYNSVNLNDCITVTCLYEYNTEVLPDVPTKLVDEATLGLLNNLYNMMLSDNAFRSEMISELKKFWPDISSETLGDLIKLTASHTTGYGPGTITINIVLPKDADPDHVQTATTAAVNNYYGRIKNSVTKTNSLRFVSCVYKQTDYAAELSARNSRYSLVSSGNSQYKSAYNALEKDVQKTVDDAIKNCNNSSDPEVYEEYLQKKADSSKMSTRSVIIQYSGIGFFAGVAVYVFIYIVLIILKMNVRGENDLENAAGIRNFGGIYVYPYTGLIGKFIHSKMIYEARTKHGKDSNRICDNIKSKLDFSDKNAFTLISVGKLSEKAQSINDEQIKILADSGISVTTVNIANGVKNVEDSAFTDLDTVVIELLGNRTGWADLQALCSRLAEYNVDVIGSEYVEA